MSSRTSLQACARLRMVGCRVLGHDTESLELRFEPNLATTRPTEDRTVVGEQTGRRSVGLNRCEEGRRHRRP